MKRRKTSLKTHVFNTVEKWSDQSSETGGTGITCEKIVFLLGMRHQTVSARLSELLKEEKIKIIGRQKISSGRTARVYEVA